MHQRKEKQMGKAIEFTDGNFQDEVIGSDVPVLVDCTAAWCGPCRMIAPIIEELAGEYEGRFKVGKLDVDGNQGSAASYGVKSIPTLLFFKGGELADRLVGAVPKAAIVEKIDALI
jgi:thioredoxin 1